MSFFARIEFECGVSVENCWNVHEIDRGSEHRGSRFRRTMIRVRRNGHIDSFDDRRNIINPDKS